MKILIIFLTIEQMFDMMCKEQMFE